MVIAERTLIRSSVTIDSDEVSSLSCYPVSRRETGNGSRKSGKVDTDDDMNSRHIDTLWENEM
jgi:hypothetical protein